MIASSIDCPATVDGDMRAMMKGHEIFIVSRVLRLPWPIPHIFRGDQFPNDLYGYVMPVIYSDRHCVELLVGDSHDALT